MQTVFVAYDAYEQDLLLPPHVQRHWRAELCPIIIRDIQRGLFGERRYNLWSYSVLYHLNLPEDALCRVRSNLKMRLEDDMHYTSSLREALTHANIWLSFELNAIKQDEDIRPSPIIQHRSSLPPTMTIGFAYESQPRASTSSSRTMVEDEDHPHSAFSSTTTLAQPSAPQYLPQPWAKHESPPFADVKARSLDMEPSPSSSSTTSSHNTTPPARPHPRHLPLDRRIKPITESSRAKKTHVVALDAESIQAFGGYGTLASPADIRRVEGESRSVVGRFLRTLGLQKKSASLPRAGRVHGGLDAHSRANSDIGGDGDVADDAESDSDTGDVVMDIGRAPGLHVPPAFGSSHAESGSPQTTIA